MHMGVVTLSLIVVAALAGPARPQTAEGTISQSIEARGGAVALEARQTVKMSANVVRPEDDLEYSMTLYRKRPTFYRLELQSADTRVVRATDGQRSWRINPLADVAQAAATPSRSGAHGSPRGPRRGWLRSPAGPHRSGGSRPSRYLRTSILGH